jgi:tRNA (guanine26-N2/guanine27-N2)-dimethyltransferase
MSLWRDIITYTEGNIEILAPKPTNAPSKTLAFYNPRMSINRDISILVLKGYQDSLKREIRVCDAMTGVGVRGIRYAKEVEQITEVVFNDRNPVSLKFTEYNIRKNRVSSKSKILKEEAANMLSKYSSSNMRFDMVDLDPFGTPTPFYDSAIRATKIGGVLAATATDMAVLCGVHSKAAKKKYGVSVLSTDYSKETAIRILIYSIIRAAAVHNIAAFPLFCYSSDHYVRGHFILKTGKSKVYDLINQIGFNSHCQKCLYRTFYQKTEEFQKQCPRCKGKLKVIGPIWLGSLFDSNVCHNMINFLLSTSISFKHRVERILKLALEELNMPPLFYAINILCDKLNVPQPKITSMVTMLKNQGYKASRSHIQGNAIKTDASIEVLENLLNS